MIVVVRHGQTDWNKAGRLQGRKGGPLNEEGIEQAVRLGGRLSDYTFDYVYASPQQRAVQTAEIATGLQAIIDERLDVYDLGEADGLTQQEVQLRGGVPDASVYSGMEDPMAYADRVFAFMDELKEKHAGEEVNILIAGHQCTTGCIAAYFEGLPEDLNILKLASRNGEYKVYAIDQPGGSQLRTE